MPGVRQKRNGDDAHERVPVLLGVPLVQGRHPPQGRRLLRVLLVRGRALSADSGGRGGFFVLLGSPPNDVPSNNVTDNRLL